MIRASGPNTMLSFKLAWALAPTASLTSIIMVRSYRSYKYDEVLTILQFAARWNGNIVGQSGGAVTDAQLASLWSQIATKYASQSKVIFGVMNEPHDL